MQGERIAAVLKIRDAAQLSAKQAREMSDWLRQQADSLVQEGKEYDPMYKAMYYEPRVEKRT